ncbi:hypothetical protein [Hymenobacter cavernae]|uniref:DUF4843 domain-containing protein n=1 Tax=Hymenobacter cavernae TaxID=2044852 RepID=A0ABQ1TGS2_9BACT|nr:hypothetical protein [Hymenobacter cavernae]GGE94998.1 hypothetical protein GCM10011383_02150 [Hymenobacter cavernae]
MKNNIAKLLTLCLLSLGTVACEKDYGVNLGPTEDSIAPIPVTVTNATYFERYAIVTAKAPTTTEAGDFSITFEIPADKGRIKEISRVVTGAAGLTYLQSSVRSTITTPPRSITPAELSLNYNGNAASPGTNPVLGNGTNSITFTSSLRAYNTYRNRVGPLLDVGATGLALIGPAPTVATSVTAPTQIRMFFLITLEDGTEIIPTEVRVRVI